MIIISLAACSTTPQQIQITSKPIDKPELVLPDVDEVDMRKVEWIILTEDNMDVKIAELKAGGGLWQSLDSLHKDTKT